MLIHKIQILEGVTHNYKIRKEDMQSYIWETIDILNDNKHAVLSITFTINSPTLFPSSEEVIF